MVFVILILFQITIIGAAFKSQIYRLNGNILLYNSSTGLNKDLFNSQPITKICMLKKQFFTKFQQTLSIRSRQGFFNVEAFSNARETIVTGIGTAKYDPQLDEYESKIKILTRCRVDDTSFLAYTLILKLVSSNQTTIIQIPVGLSCFPDAYNIRVEYIILQFLVGGIFIVLMIIFSNSPGSVFRLNHQPIHIALFLILPLFQKPYIFPLYINGMFIYKFFFLNLNVVRTIKLILGSCIICIGLSWVQMNFSSYFHYLFNLMTIHVGLVVFKPKRFRHVVVILLAGVYLLSYYKNLTAQNISIQIILPALFKNQNYACVYFSIYDILLPLLPSIFITRSFKLVTPIKNIHVLVHFVTFLGIGLYEALSKMGGINVKSMAESVAVAIVVNSCIVSLFQGNLKKLVTFRDSTQFLF